MRKIYKKWNKNKESGNLARCDYALTKM